MRLCFVLPKGSTVIRLPELTFHEDGLGFVLPNENQLVCYGPDKNAQCHQRGDKTGRQ